MGYRRGRLNKREEREYILAIIDEACEAGATQQSACKVLEITPKTLQRWRKGILTEDRRTTRKIIPHNKMSVEEEEKILKVINQNRYAYYSPAKIVPLLADEGNYLASESTMYRLLRKNNQLSHRGISKPRSNYKPKSITATRPNQVYSWDITYLISMVKGKFFYLYLFLDIYSRKIVGWQVYDKESSEYASDLLEAICIGEGIQKDQLIVHSDNGAPMKGATTLQKLGVIPSFSRPGVSDDNAYSEALFRTVKYSPKYPEKPFADLEMAREWVAEFVKWYNYEHLHSGIKFVTPNQRHEGFDNEILKHRKEIYLKAKQEHPQRWSREIRNWNKLDEVLLNPEKCKSETKRLGAVV